MSVVAHFISGPFRVCKIAQTQHSIEGFGTQFYFLQPFFFFFRSIASSSVVTITRELSETRQPLLQAWCVTPNGPLIIDRLHELFRWSRGQCRTRARISALRSSHVVRPTTKKGLLTEPSISGSHPLHSHTMSARFCGLCTVV